MASLADLVNQARQPTASLLGQTGLLPPVGQQGLPLGGDPSAPAGQQPLPAPGPYQAPGLNDLAQRSSDRLGFLAASQPPQQALQPPPQSQLGGIPTPDGGASTAQLLSLANQVADHRAIGAGVAPGSLRGSSGAVRLASTQLGAPYVWAASNPLGPRGGPGGAFDCSGLTQWVFSRLGVQLPHNAQAQSQMVAHVSRQNLQPGDLLFFGSPGSIHHVAIYVGGNRMIDAPHSGANVRVERIWGDFAFGGRVR